MIVFGLGYLDHLPSFALVVFRVKKLDVKMFLYRFKNSQMIGYRCELDENVVGSEEKNRGNQLICISWAVNVSC